MVTHKVTQPASHEFESVAKLILNTSGKIQRNQCIISTFNNWRLAIFTFLYAKYKVSVAKNVNFFLTNLDILQSENKILQTFIFMFLFECVYVCVYKW